MTDKERVQHIHPSAAAMKVSWGGWYIFVGLICIGKGQSRDEAWRDAAERMK